MLGDSEDLPAGRRLPLLRGAEAEVVEDASDGERVGEGVVILHPLSSLSVRQ